MKRRLHTLGLATMLAGILASPASAAFVSLPSSGAQVNDDAANSIDTKQDAGLVDVSKGVKQQASSPGSVGWRSMRGADYFAVAVPLGHAIGRIGRFVAGCCHGRSGHPVQLYEALGVARPRVEHGGDPEASAEAAGVEAEGEERAGGGPEEEREEAEAMAQGEGAELGGEREGPGNPGAAKGGRVRDPDGGRQARRARRGERGTVLPGVVRLNPRCRAAA